MSRHTDSPRYHESPETQLRNELERDCRINREGYIAASRAIGEGQNLTAIACPYPHPHDRHEWRRGFFECIDDEGVSL